MKKPRTKRAAVIPGAVSPGAVISGAVLPDAVIPDSLIPFVPPQLATLVDRPPQGEQWFHELKFDGYRTLCRLQDGQVTLFTRTGQDWTNRFAQVATAAAKLPVGTTLFDGEVAVLKADGTTDFQALQNHLQGEGKGALTYFVFDLLFLDGVNLRDRPLEERKQALSRALAGIRDNTIRYSDHVVGDGPAFFEKACAAGLEGIVSKQRDQPYRSGRSPSWLKTKALQRQEFVVGGFTEPEGSRTGIGALLVGQFHGDVLGYAGKVGTGFSQRAAMDVRQRLDRLLADRSPFDSAVPREGRALWWVKPTLVVEVAYAAITSDGKLRHASFQGLREDKAAADVVRDVPRRSPEPVPPVASPPSRRSHQAPKQDRLSGVKLTHPERLMEEASGVTKRDLAAYLADVAPYMLPHLVGRPLSLVRCPQGMAGRCFFMKHAAFSTPELRRVTIREKEEKGEYLIADTVASLVALAQMSVLEVHTWNSVEKTLEQPDRVVFDFDPGPQARWEDVIEGALLIKKRAEDIGCATFLKTTGGKGLHVVVPLLPTASWDECKVFTQLVSESVVAQHPKRFTTAMRKAGREDKVLIDYLRNNRGSTSVAAYSTRARPGMPVSLPLAWNDLPAFSPARPFTMAATISLLRHSYRDPWAAYEDSRIDLKHMILNAKSPRARDPRPRKA